ncbi:hypothetical protein Sgleb_75170 [Streptomyces glebosus]|uniref:Uncharacterized protein n=1 Tax=Streptomyces glebosus TaxID=249580 RepID=A0A640T8E3_9ACTN|nr:hypothetical protein Sgleb_75170 [Streptomyces glebosus]GHG63108.1 hypothetical protein GCM10010513_30370 [Streptomyces glebosus]
MVRAVPAAPRAAAGGVNLADGRRAGAARRMRARGSAGRRDLCGGSASSGGGRQPALIEATDGAARRQALSDGSCDLLALTSLRSVWGGVMCRIRSGLGWSRTCRRTRDEAGVGKVIAG